MEQLKPEIDECGYRPRPEPENLCVRFIRKKYRCIMLFMILTFMAMQTIYLVIEKTDSDLLKNIFKDVENMLDFNHYLNSTVSTSTPSSQNVTD